MKRDLLTKQVEESALANKDDGAKFKPQKETVDSEVGALQKELDRLRQMWVTEKDELGKGKKLQE